MDQWHSLFSWNHLLDHRRGSHIWQRSSHLEQPHPPSNDRLSKPLCRNLHLSDAFSPDPFWISYHHPLPPPLGWARIPAFILPHWIPLGHFRLLPTSEPPFHT